MIILATLSYRFIESPLRRSDTLNRFGNVGLGVTSVFVATITIQGVNASRKALFLGGKRIYEDNRLYYSLDLDGNSGRRLIVLGDSHAGAIGALLEEIGRAHV